MLSDVILLRCIETIKRVTLKTHLYGTLVSPVRYFHEQIENNGEDIKCRTEHNQYNAATAIQLLTG